MSQNSQQGKYENCYVAFLDILGLKNKVAESVNDEQKLKTLIESIEEYCKISGIETKQTGKSDLNIKIRFFSDSLVFFMRQDGDISQMLFLIRFIQDQLWGKGLCLRGGITLDEMFWCDNKNITIGPGLVEAYKLENEIAIYPRIIISENLYDRIKDNHVGPFGANENLKLDSLIKEDNDGLFFLDLLNKNINRPENEKLKIEDNSFYIKYENHSEDKRRDILSAVDNTIKNNISDKPKIQQKYKWLKSYMNSSRAETNEENVIK